MDYNYNQEEKRVGYGSNFNNIYIDHKTNTIKKVCFNDYGMKKITYEKKFYEFLINHTIDFPVPKIHCFLENGYIMDYLYDYKPLYKIFTTCDKEKQNEIIIKITQYLKNLHDSNKILITKDEYYKHLNIEINIKLLQRYEVIKSLLQNYDYIKKVNNVEIIPFHTLVDLIQKEIYKIVNNANEYSFVPLHGDCQFNNILYNEGTQQLCFIDPRGYYGEKEIFGIREYDYAKIIFALSGYDEFDNRHVDKLNINGDNISIQTDDLLDTHAISHASISSNKLGYLLMLSIWLGNSHCFINNENKAVYSYFIGLYLGSKYFT
uniref:Aminoglycoside phosphotransferase domain-containing protein n=1 Tax=viral metagenome TaxID=1070528 RepID=A0A6C0BXI7_9ZZZZ